MSQTQALDRPKAGAGAVAVKSLDLRGMLAQDNVKARFSEVLGPRRGAQFISSIITVVGASKALKECDPQSVIGAAAQAAALDLSIVPTIGQAAIVPYSGSAQFQIMTRGIVQLAHRTSKYKRLHLAEVYEGQLVSYDEFTGEVKLNAAGRKSDKVVGFFFRFELVNGFLHETFWSAARCVEHGYKYSKSFQRGHGLWMEDPLIPTKKGQYGPVFDRTAFKGMITPGSGTFAMCAKTVVKNTLNKWGPLSSDMVDAFTADQAAIMPDGSKKFIDTTLVNGAEAEEAAPPAPMPGRASEAPKAEADGGEGANAQTDMNGEKLAGAVDGGGGVEQDQDQPFITFAVDGVASTEKEGKKAWVVYRDGDRAKFFTALDAVANLARKAKESGKPVQVEYEVKGSGKTAEHWIRTIEIAG